MDSVYFQRRIQKHWTEGYQSGFLRKGVLGHYLTFFGSILHMKKTNFPIKRRGINPLSPPLDPPLMAEHLRKNELTILSENNSVTAGYCTGINFDNCKFT